MKLVWPERYTVLALLLGSFLLRLVPPLLWPNLNWPDEIFQTLEPAHRAAFGYGLRSWEFRDGARSWLLPGFLALIMRIGEPLLPGAWGYLLAVNCTMALLGTMPVLVAWAWARRLHEPAALWVAASVAVFCDLVYFGSKPLSEAAAAHLVIAGLYLARFHDERLHRLCAAGALFGAAMAVRIHLAPAVLAAAVITLRRASRRERVALAAALASVVLFSGLLDLVTWGTPFGSYSATFRHNVVEGKGERWGVFPITQYVGWYGNVWGFGLLAAGAGLVSMWRRERALVVTAIVVIATHSVIAHKEYRFVYPATVLIVVATALAGAIRIGTLHQRWPVLRRSGGPLLFALAGSLSATAYANFDPVHTGNFFGPRATQSHFTWLAGRRHAMRVLSLDDRVCGVALVGIPWFLSGGYSHLHKQVPLILIENVTELAASDAAFNVALTLGRAALLPPWELERCDDDTCTYGRSGHCAIAPGYDVNRVIESRGE